jgi:hypothetical protein
LSKQPVIESDVCSFILALFVIVSVQRAPVELR